MNWTLSGLASLIERPWLPWLTILIPLIGGAFIGIFRFGNNRQRNGFIMLVTLINSVICWFLVLFPPETKHVLIKFTGFLDFAVQIDGLGRIFIALMATLWPLTTLYAFSYMESENGSTRFFVIFTMTYGVAVGVAEAANLLTLYCFFELLSLITVPLVMHDFTPQAVHAARKYLYYMLGGTAFAFIGLIFVIVYGVTEYFLPGGVFSETVLAENGTMLRIVFLLTFCGFGAKAAIFPLHGWLPSASVAPTPVTALLHAVAVVNAGVFAITRVAYEIFGEALLRGTWVQTVALLITIFTILYGSCMAVRESNLKKRLAYSTVSNLSYMLLGIVMLTDTGLCAGLLHMIFHSLMKIALFFCAGAILIDGRRANVDELNGYARVMPVTFGCFIVSGMALIGIPPLCGFVSKWALVKAAFTSLNAPIASVAAAALLISALLTAVYILVVCVRACFSPSSERNRAVARQDPDARKLIPMILTSLASILAGLGAHHMITLITVLAGSIR